MSILDHPQVLQVLFHPRPDYPVQAAGVLPVAVEVESGVSVGGCLYPCHPTAPVILYFHGNGLLRIITILQNITTASV